MPLILSAPFHLIPLILTLPKTIKLGITRPGTIHLNPGIGSALASHLRLTITPLSKTDIWPSGMAVLSTNSWISLGSTAEKRNNRAGAFRQQESSAIKEIAPPTDFTFRVRNANFYSCSHGTLLSQESCKLNMLQNLMKPKYIIDKNKI